MGAVDDYFDSLDATTRAAFERVRRVTMEVAPTAEQGTSYGIAALMYEQRPLLGFRAAKRHLSIFPFGSGPVNAVRDRLQDFDLSSGTIRFTAEKPLPDEAVREVVRSRIAEIERRKA